MTNETRLQQELSDVRVELAELRSRSDNTAALANDDHYWSLCVRERQMLRLFRRERDQVSDVDPYAARRS
jgi:hypothetical protein